MQGRVIVKLTVKSVFQIGARLYILCDADTLNGPCFPSNVKPKHVLLIGPERRKYFE